MKQTKGGTMFEQKEIVLMPFPYSDLTGSKQRPALIISNKKLNNTEDRICCLITSNKPKDGILITNKDLENGKMPFESWIKPQRLFTINDRIIKKRLCSITRDFHNKVVKEVNEYIRKED